MEQGGQVELLFDPVITAAPLVQGGRLKALAVAAPSRSATLPEVKTLAESGTPGVDAGVWFGMVAKAGTPDAVVKTLNDEVRKALASPDVVKRFTDQGLARFRVAYASDTISKDDVFYYVYGLLHSPDYRTRFADNRGSWE